MEATITTRKRKIRQAPRSAVTELHQSVRLSWISPKSIFPGEVSVVETNTERGEAYVHIDGGFICFCIPIDALPEWLKAGQRVIVDAGEMKVYRA